MTRKLTVITCPKCGAEYLPSEIYVPNAFFGRPEIIKRDVDGHISDFIGSTLDVEESYCCDCCNTTFKVTAKISFTTQIDDKADFEHEYQSALKPRFALKEF